MIQQITRREFSRNVASYLDRMLSGEVFEIEGSRFGTLSDKKIEEEVKVSDKIVSRNGRISFNLNTEPKEDVRQATDEPMVWVDEYYLSGGAVGFDEKKQLVLLSVARRNKYPYTANECDNEIREETSAFTFRQPNDKMNDGSKPIPKPVKRKK